MECVIIKEFALDFSPNFANDSSKVKIRDSWFIKIVNVVFVTNLYDFSFFITQKRR